MGWWDRVGTMPWPWQRAPETKPIRYVEEKTSASGPAISYGYLGAPVWTPRRYECLADEAYLRNAVAFRCVKLIASAAASAPWLLSTKAGQEVDEHPLLNLLKRPAPMVGGHSLFEAVYAYLLLAGNSYLEGVGPNDKAPPRELWALRPDRMKVLAGGFGLPKGYEYQANGNAIKWDVDPITGRGPIIHVKEFHPLNDWYGLSRVEPAAYGVDRHNAASAHNKALLDNGARPSGALVFEPIKMPDGSVQTAPEAVIKKAETDLRAKTGPKEAGRVHVFGGSVHWEEMGITPKDMDFAEGKADAARDICLSFGVPHILVVPGTQTYNNIREAKLELWEDTILPLIDKVADQLDAQLCPQFGDGLALGIDLDEIPALEPRREARRTSVVTLLDKGVIDPDEAREALQYGPRKAGSVTKIDAAVLKALVDAAKADTAMFEPLLRYMRSVGLVDQNTTAEQLLATAEALLANHPELEAANTPPAPTPPAPVQEDPSNAPA